MNKRLLAGLVLAATPLAAQAPLCTSHAQVEARSAYFQNGFVLTQRPVLYAQGDIRACKGNNHAGVTLAAAQTVAGSAGFTPALEVGRTFGDDAEPHEQMTFSIGVRRNSYSQPRAINTTDTYLHIRAGRALVMAEQEASTRHGVHLGAVVTDTVRQLPRTLMRVRTQLSGGLVDHYQFLNALETDYYLGARIASPIKIRSLTLEPSVSAQVTFGTHWRRATAVGISATYR